MTRRQLPLARIAGLEAGDRGLGAAEAAERRRAGVHQIRLSTAPMEQPHLARLATLEREIARRQRRRAESRPVADLGERDRLLALVGSGRRPGHLRRRPVAALLLPPPASKEA